MIPKHPASILSPVVGWSLPGLPAVARTLVLLLVLVFMSACASGPGKARPLAKQNISQLQTGLTTKHPSAYVYLARELWQDDEKDQAVVMYYVGQIRYRAYINTLPTAEAAPEERLYDSLKADIGDELNEYAARNLNNWLALLDKALEWHRDNPNEFMPKEDYSLLYELTIYNFNKLRDYIEENKALIRQQRAAKGLVNE